MSATHPARGAAPPEGRRTRNKREKLERIVRAATGLFREQGFDATTGRQVCEQAGIATGTLFLYVRDKRELLFLMFRPRAEGVFARLPPGLSEGQGVVDGLMGLFGGLMRMYGRDRPLARLFVQELLFRSDQADAMRALSAELGRRVRRMVEEARARGELRGDVPVAEMVSALGAHYMHWIQLWLGTGAVGQRAAERGLRRSLELQVSGLAPRASRGEGGER
ncbi:MAG: TetR/AcrR family transcriptional regulator [Pseudomonadales bacterium]